MLNSQVSGVAIQQRLRYSQSLKPCESQRPIPNHQSSFCSIFLLLLTLSIIRSSCPPSHRWASLGFHFAGLNPISPVGPSGWPGWGGIQSTSTGHWGSSGIGSWTPPLSTYTTSLGPIIQAHGFSYHFYADDTQLYLSFQPDDPTVAARISGCLADISAWMKENHLQLQPGKDWASCRPCHSDSTAWLLDSIRHINNYPINFGQNLGVIFDDQLTFKEHIAKTARSCRFALHNIRKIRPFLTEHAAQLLVQALVVSRLDYCNALLAGLPWNTIKPLQMIQNAAARLVFKEPKKNPCYTSLHLTALATSGSSHQVQDTDACIQNDHRLSTLLLPLTITNLHPLQKSEIC